MMTTTMTITRKDDHDTTDETHDEYQRQQMEAAGHMDQDNTASCLGKKSNA